MVTLCHRDAIGTPDGIPSIEFWQPAWGGNFGQVPQDEEKTITFQRCCPLQRYLRIFLHLKDEKNEPLQVFQLEKHQGLSNPKLHWCCAGGTIHRWGLDSIKKIAVLIWRSGATGSFYIPKTLQICILILHHHCIQYYNTKDQPFPAARMDVSFVHLLGQHICRSPIWSGRHDKRWKTNLWGKEVIRTFLSKGDYGMPSKTFQYHTLKFQ